MIPRGEAKAQCRALGDLLGAWMDYVVQDPPVLPATLQEVLAGFTLAESAAVVETLHEARLDPRFPPLRVPKRGWMRGPVVIDVKPHLYPIALLELKVNQDGDVSACLRVALFFADAEQGGNASDVDDVPETPVHVNGYRYETAEQRGHVHPFTHQQCIGSWVPGISLFSSDLAYETRPDLARKSPPKPIHETRPATPMPGVQLCNLAAGMIAALYGAPTATEIVARGLRASGVNQDAVRLLKMVLPDFR